MRSNASWGNDARRQISGAAVRCPPLRKSEIRMRALTPTTRQQDTIEIDNASLGPTVSNT